MVHDGDAGVDQPRLDQKQLVTDDTVEAVNVFVSSDALLRRRCD